MDIAKNILTTFKDNLDLLKKVITGAKSWVYAYDVENLNRSVQKC